MNLRGPVFWIQAAYDAALRDKPGVIVNIASVGGLRAEGALHVYANRCPHRGTELDWLPGRFLDPAGKHLQCATHGARFRPDTGECIAGPCRGQALAAVPFAVRDGRVVLDAG
mgnify:CR=1 FL=1